RPFRFFAVDIGGVLFRCAWISNGPVSRDPFFHIIRVKSLSQSLIEFFQHRIRGARRSNQPVALLGFEAFEARLFHCRNVRQHRRAAQRTRAEGTQITGPNVPNRRRKTAENHRYVSPEPLVDRRTGALERNMRERDAGLISKHDRCKMIYGADAAGPIGKSLWILLRLRNQFLNALSLNRGPDHKNDRTLGNYSDRGEILARII